MYGVQSSVQLRPYQAQAIDSVQVEWEEQDNAQVLVSLPTGTGKTVVFTSLIGLLQEAMPKTRALIVAHRDELVSQAADKLKWVTGMDAGVIKAERHEPEPFTVVGSIQSFTERRLAKLSSWHVDVLVIDEAHHAQADNMYGRLIEHLRAINPELRVLGVTATPYRSDSRGLGGVFDKVAYRYSLREAIEDGYLTPLDGVTVRTGVNLDGVRVVAGDLHQGELAQVVNVDNRNDLICTTYLEHCRREDGSLEQAVAFCVNVAHAQQLAERMKSHHVRASAIWGDMGMDARRRTLADYEAGKLDILCNCGVLTEGWDHPPLAAVLLCAPTRSKVKYVQCVGRGTRLFDGKAICRVIDFADTTSRLELIGLPDLTDPDAPRPTREQRDRAEGEHGDVVVSLRPKGEGLETYQVSLFGNNADELAAWSKFGTDYVATTGHIKAMIAPTRRVAPQAWSDACRLQRAYPEGGRIEHDTARQILGVRRLHDTRLMRAVAAAGGRRSGSGVEIPPVGTAQPWTMLLVKPAVGSDTLATAAQARAEGRPWCIRLEYVGDNDKNKGGTSSKFWEASGAGPASTVQVRWGKIGSHGQPKAKDWAYVAKTMPTKLAKGYDYVKAETADEITVQLGGSVQELASVAQAAFDAEETPVLMRASAAWRRRPATPRQCEDLRRECIEVNCKALTAGEADGLLAYNELQILWSEYVEKAEEAA
jgi:superfamily II DNA or RNA helicase/predicted DNA-binding WGR domain protein